MNNEEHFEISLHTSIIAIVVIGVVVGASYFYNYTGYKDIALENQDLQKQLFDHQTELENIRKEINLLRFESTGKVDELNQKLSQEKVIRESIETQMDKQSLASQKKISSLENRLSLTSLSSDLSSVIKNWEKLIVLIDCDFSLANSYLSYSTSGSGTALAFPNSPIKIVTNKHVLVAPYLYSMNGCVVKVQGSTKEFFVSPEGAEVSANNYDWGILEITDPDENLTKITEVFPNICEQKPSLGDSVIVLGYPDIGSKTTITATEGIVSGFDGDYFITSAKVEQGNSGGAAILSKKNCLLGIPTYASLGEVESLARILDIWTVLTKN
ncbi:MAG: hypothetical protein UR79_C0004G0034 [Candidatus Campbellbacteria bacterium GW2011_GWD1_35_49]|nr:MAG: Peptidase cysteine/serine, trypsin-like protein [Candidatus Campbellbacteria bacterium GW2011_OD1_34_28]KKP74545.1 MAG: hypothetical protein UR74_C0004G0034 [Candidatus Campbellbacteria bacterium GW2011_GWD2_35_24]KKP76544.1 MAG: hypothetical protein UR76_C0004G0034 [Candidatus Campbellbacteria bacterium GW2011_GWC1_35_31]KKP78583.1 MAG: hypothetical protein UR79_C0004G0034 [Candidatus Campbellbacteria bacterium GW2011_GWD1_35_49]HAP74442.1 hypothetical protein [Candidatus Campbellbacte